MRKPKLNVSFKKDSRETGLAAVCYTRSTNIKLNKLWWGRIQSPRRWPERLNWEIMIRVLHNDGGNCPWEWITVQNCDSEPEARIWIKANVKDLNERYELYAD